MGQAVGEAIVALAESDQASVAPATTSPPLRSVVDAEEALLVERAREDPRAFAPLYDRYFDAIYRYCYRRLGDRERAADATSQVFARALGALPRYRSTGSFRAWLFTIAHNAVVDSYRDQRPHAPLDAALGLPDAGPSPDETALAAEARQTVADLLAQLPEEQRRVVALRLAGLTGPEIAAATGRTLNAVKSSQFRAYSRLRRLLGGETDSTEPRR